MKKYLLIFSIIAGISGYTGYKIGFGKAKKLYEDLADKEVESVKNRLKEYYENPKEQKEPKEPNDTKKPIVNKSIEKNGRPSTSDRGSKYRTASTDNRVVGEPEGSSNIKSLKKDPEVIDTSKPHIITPEEFADSNNQPITLFYLADKTLTDDDYNIIENIGIVGGYVLLDQIGLYNSGEIHIRDNKNGIDYEVVLDEREYKDIKSKGIVHDED